MVFNFEPRLEDTALSHMGASLMTQFGASGKTRPGRFFGEATFTEPLLSVQCSYYYNTPIMVHISIPIFQMIKLRLKKIK